jgi:hypothetical protein
MRLRQGYREGFQRYGYNNNRRVSLGQSLAAVLTLNYEHKQ